MTAANIAPAPRGRRPRLIDPDGDRRAPGLGDRQAMMLGLPGHGACQLPNSADRSRHLAVANLANSLPNSLVPAFGGLVITSAGGYPGLYGLIAAGAALTAALVLPIRSVR